MMRLGWVKSRATKDIYCEQWPTTVEVVEVPSRVGCQGDQLSDVSGPPLCALTYRPVSFTVILLRGAEGESLEASEGSEAAMSREHILRV